MSTTKCRLSTESPGDRHQSLQVQRKGEIMAKGSTTYSMHSLLIKIKMIELCWTTWCSTITNERSTHILFPRSLLINSSSRKDIQKLADQNSLCKYQKFLLRGGQPITWPGLRNKYIPCVTLLQCHSNMITSSIYKRYYCQKVFAA